MTHEAIRHLNAGLAFTLIWLWIFWGALRFKGLASRIVCACCLPVWAWISAGAWNAAEQHLQYNAAATWGPLVLGILDLAIAVDLARALVTRARTT